MDGNVSALVNAILELKPHVGVFKGYILPIATPLFSAIMGGFIALRINRIQEEKRSESKKLNDVNKLILDVFEAQALLIVMKGNYMGVDSSNPYARAFSFPEMLTRSRELKIETSDYLFIKPIKTCNFTKVERLKRFFLRKKEVMPDDSDLGKSWRNLTRLSAMVSNYNTIMFQIDKRNNLDDEVRGNLIDVLEKSNPKNEFEFNKIFLDCLGRKKTSNIVELTESTISLIDYIILQMHDFLIKFPEVAQSNIDLSKVEMKKIVLRVNNERPAYINALKPIIKPDFDALAKILNVDKSEVEYKYNLPEWY